MRLRELEAFLLYEVSPNGDTFRRDSPLCPSLDVAQGIMFLCPKCFVTNNGPIGTHSVVCWFKGRVPDNLDPGPGRWNPIGTGIDDITFVPPGAISVQLVGGCGWHGFVKNGDAS